MTPCLPQSHRMKFDSIDHLFIFEQQFWNIILVIEFPHIFFPLMLVLAAHTCAIYLQMYPTLRC